MKAYDLKLVDYQSASLLSKRIIYLTTDHSGLNKFNGPEDENFLLIKPEVQRSIQNASQRVEEQYQCIIYFPYSRLHVFHGFSDFLLAPVEISEKKSFHVEFSLQGIPMMNYFVARDAEITQLTQNLLPTTVDLMRRKVFILHGLGGIGKTQLSVEFARQYHKKYTAVFWVDGSTKERLRQSIADLAGRLPQHQISENSRNYSQEKSIKNNADVNEIVKDVLNWLSQSSNDQ